MKRSNYKYYLFKIFAIWTFKRERSFYVYLMFFFQILDLLWLKLKLPLCLIGHRADVALVAKASVTTTTTRRAAHGRQNNANEFHSSTNASYSPCNATISAGSCLGVRARCCTVSCFPAWRWSSPRYSTSSRSTIRKRRSRSRSSTCTWSWRLRPLTFWPLFRLAIRLLCAVHGSRDACDSACSRRCCVKSWPITTLATTSRVCLLLHSRPWLHYAKVSFLFFLLLDFFSILKD